MNDVSDEPSGDAWGRPRYQLGGGDALLYYLILGDFPPDFAPVLVRERYRLSGAAHPALTLWTRDDHPSRFDDLLGGAIGRLLDTEYPALAPVARSAPAMVAVRVDQTDPTELLYLRDTVGIVAALLEQGGVACLDGMALEWWEPERFQQEIFAPDRAQPLRHTTILVSEDERDAVGHPTVWVHTRGMRKFGRPDISVRTVPEAKVGAVVGLCNRLIAYQARGGVVPEGESVRLPDLPEGLTLHHTGDLDDPDFNNVHLTVHGTL